VQKRNYKLQLGCPPFCSIIIRIATCETPWHLAMNSGFENKDVNWSKFFQLA